MKKYSFVLLGLLIFHLNGYSQRLYMKASGSFSVAASPQQYTTSHDYYFNNSYFTKQDYKSEQGSYGAGMRSTLSLGTMFTDNFGFELEASYLKGKKQQSFFNIFTNEYSDKATTKSYSRLLAFAPTFLFTSKGKLFSPYAKAGLLIGRPTIIQETTRVNTQKQFASDPNQIYTQNFEITGKTALGLQGGLGTNITVSERFTVFSEVTFATLSFTPVQGKTTAYQVDGEDYMNGISEAEKTTEYVGSFSTQDNEHTSKPRKALNSPLPFNFVGVQIGIQLNIINNE